MAQKYMEKTKGLLHGLPCIVSMHAQVGDPKNVICHLVSHLHSRTFTDLDQAEKYDAAVVILGSRGLGTVKRYDHLYIASIDVY